MQETIGKIENELFRLRFLLKRKIATFSEIGEEEVKIINVLNKVFKSIRDIEEELLNTKRIKKFGSKLELIGNVLNEEIEIFSKEYFKKRDVYDICNKLEKRLSKLKSLIESNNIDNKKFKDFKNERRVYVLN